ncbi:Tannase/feruloyl esterase [Bisporella sp. PMI_857]|nr:Tannase/feruloyl esterase [Bisporella sp. PMI_857]
MENKGNEGKQVELALQRVSRLLRPSVLRLSTIQSGQKISALLPTIAMRESLPIHACSGGLFSPPQVSGAHILTISAAEQTNYSIPLYEITGLNFCEVNVTYTHPGRNDTIHVQAWLPLSGYNLRFRAVGGGGYAGSLGDIALGPALLQGYATAATDGGTNNDPYSPAEWALISPGVLNYAVLEDYAYLSLDELAVIGKAITTSFYGTAPIYSYFTGCSNGGRQGLTTAQRYPTRYNGILANAPAIRAPEFVPSLLWGQVVMHAFRRTPPPVCEFTAITAAAVAACDGLDKVIDGVMSNYTGCKFDPLTLVGTSFNCSGTSRTFSTAGTTITQKIWQGPTTPIGTSLWNGYHKDADLTELISETIVQLGHTVPSPSLGLGRSWIKYFVLKNPTVDLSTITYNQFYQYYIQSVAEFRAILGNDNPDLSAFKVAGGKMITWHGGADPLIPIDDTIQYYQSAEALDSNIEDFYRFFIAPGVGHCSGGVGFYPSNDLAALVNWVENGIAPTKLSGTSATSGRSQPLCQYPLVARWDGINNSALATSYTCATSY